MPENEFKTWRPARFLAAAPLHLTYPYITCFSFSVSVETPREACPDRAEAPPCHEPFHSVRSRSCIAEGCRRRLLKGIGEVFPGSKGLAVQIRQSSRDKTETRINLRGLECDLVYGRIKRGLGFMGLGFVGSQLQRVMVELLRVETVNLRRGF